MVYQFIKVTNDQSGQLQKEDGSRFDWAKYLEISQEYDVNFGIENGKVYQSFWDGTIGANGVLYFHQTFLSPDVKYKGILFKQIILGGDMTFRIFLNATPGTTLETRLGYNLDRRRLVSGVNWTSQNPIHRVDGLTGGVQVDQWFESLGGTGSKTTSTPIEELGVIGIYDSSVSRSYSITNDGTGSHRIGLVWTWKEI